MGNLHGRLIAFDLDGTLVDSRRDLAGSANQLIRELGGTPLSDDAIGRMVGEGAAVLVDRALRAAGVLPPQGGSDGHEVLPLQGDGPEDGTHAHAPVASGFSRKDPGFSRKALQRFLEIYDSQLLNHTRAYDGIAEAVAVARRYARVAVLTNKPSHATGRVLEGLGLRELFDDVIGGDTMWPRKPNPASLRDLMRRASASPATTLLVGDSAIDHETACRAGSRCCLAAYGFGFVTFPMEQLTGEEWIVRTPAELEGVFARFRAA